MIEDKRQKSQDKSERISLLSPPFGGLGGKNQDKRQK